MQERLFTPNQDETPMPAAPPGYEWFPASHTFQSSTPTATAEKIHRVVVNARCRKVSTMPGINTVRIDALCLGRDHDDATTNLHAVIQEGFRQ